MMSMTEGVNADLDSDGEWTTKDRYGIIHVDDTPGLLINAFNSRYVTKDSEGNLSLTIAEEETVTKIMHMIEAFSDHTVVFNVSHRSDNINVDEMGMFMANQALFSMAGIWYCPTYRSMEKDFGILPFPKYDEYQESYHHLIMPDGDSVIGVPLSCGKTELTAYMLEALSAESYYTVYPAFYDVVLMGKFTRDPESQDMLKIIFDTRTYDIGSIYGFGSFYGQLITYAANKGDSNLASLFASNLSAIESSIDKLNDLIDQWNE
jgi:hypothetical protein